MKKISIINFLLMKNYDATTCQSGKMNLQKKNAFFKTNFDEYTTGLIFAPERWQSGRMRRS